MGLRVLLAASAALLAPTTGWLPALPSSSSRSGSHRRAPHIALGISEPAPPAASTAEIMQRVEQRESNARTYCRNFPIVIAKGDGIYLWDIDGKRYIDCLAGAGTLSLGHNPKLIKQVMKDFLDGDVPLSLLDLATVEKDEFV